MSYKSIIGVVLGQMSDNVRMRGVLRHLSDNVPNRVGLRQLFDGGFRVGKLLSFLTIIGFKRAFGCIFFLAFGLLGLLD